MPWGFQYVEAPWFQDSSQVKVVTLSALRTDHLYPHELFLGLISVIGWVDSMPIVRPGLCHWKIPMAPTGNEIATRTGESWDRTPVGATFSASVQSGPGAHPTSFTMGTRSFPGVMRLGAVALTTHLHLVPRLRKE